MDRFKFRLEKVKSYKERLKQESEQIFSQRISNLNNAKMIKEKLEEEKDREKTSNDGILTAAELSLVGDYEKFVQTLLDKQKGVIQEAEKAVEMAREDLIEKAKDEKALSLLREKKLEEFKEEKKRRERKDTSEVALRQFRKNKDGIE